MVKKPLISFLTACCLLIFSGAMAQTEISFAKYHNPKDVNDVLKQMNQAYPEKTTLHNIATSPGGNPVQVLEIGKNLKDKPAVFVGANFEGITPISTEGAIYLAKMILESEEYSKIKWYILPLPNPDAAQNYFSSVVYEKRTNALPINADVDDQTDEDGFDDLNKDGYITQMRVKSPDGSYVISKKDPRIMQRADSRKGERGEYKLYTEGIDNDGDGEYNEDQPGGVNIGISFPHLFNPDNKDAGLYSGYSPETFAIMKFICDRPEIVMTQTLGTSDYCIAPPKSGRRGGANLQSIQVPRRFASRIGADPDKTYTMDQIIEMVKPMVPEGTEVSPSMIASMMDLGMVVNPLDEDLKFYTQLSDDYKTYLKSKKFSTDRLDAEPDKDGSFELWAYYQLGVPSFSMNLFTVPKVKEAKSDEGLSLDSIEKMSADDFISLGEAKIDTFLKANKAPGRMNTKNAIEMVKSGRTSPKQLVATLKNAPKADEEGGLPEKDKALLAYSDNTLGGKGFANWKPFTHPTLGQVEIGGYVPFMENTPQPGMIDSLCKTQLPWLLKLTTKLPEIKFMDQKITDLGSGVYRLEIFVENKGFFAYPIGMGQRNKQPAPVVITLEGADLKFLDGLKRTPLGAIGGNQVKKLTWIIKMEKPQAITAKMESKSVANDVKQIKIGG
jgi:hypothetical protein